MSYELEFFRRTDDEPSGKSIKRYVSDFVDLDAAKAHCVSKLRDEKSVDEADGCRIYCDGVYKSTVSTHPEPRHADRP